MSVATESATVLRKNYQPPNFWIDDVQLEFDLDPTATQVSATIKLRRNSEASGTALELDGKSLELLSVAVDGNALSDQQYTQTATQLIIDELPDEFVLTTKVQIDPESNKSLYGLYLSSGNFCTQCEAMGFRSITYFMDRPDVMTKFRVTLRGDKTAFPILLSNGNRVASADLDDGRHEVTWEDPHVKPSYLFALVAGDLKCHRGTFTTCSGREVVLEIWVEPKNIELCEHALVSLQKSMKWDEEVFGLEYDLDIYMIVAVNDFNMGAMENKGLNVFNSKYVLASPETATDDDFLGVERVIAHEYFHNWTGNRVTCRDWFQLTLKEGLTVFRDQQFTADQTSAAVKRVDDVVTLRARQFPEDSGPMAHPIRPESYISMDNFYTATVYNKGAEIIRMYHTLLGPEGFRRGMDLYFQRHDGAAVTCDDFRAAMADANDSDFSRFDRWYSQAGTPDLNAATSWNESDNSLTISFEQSYPSLPESIPGASDRQPVPIPISVGLLDDSANEVAVALQGENESATPGTRTLLMEQTQQSFTLVGLKSQPVVSILRGFSAPVRLSYERSDQELATLMAQDTDTFNRWEAGQNLATRLLLALCESGVNDIPAGVQSSLDLFVETVGSQLSGPEMDGAYRSLLLTLPGESTLAQEMSVVDSDAIFQAREFLKKRIAESHYAAMKELFVSLSKDEFSKTQDSVNRRRLKNTLLAFLMTTKNDESIGFAKKQFADADNMTDSQAALCALVELGPEHSAGPLADFYERWRHDELVLDKWFAVQAASKRDDVISTVQSLAQHSDFTLLNPNRVRALLATFGANQVRFHQADGAGYELLSKFIQEIDSNNPQLAARLVSLMNGYKRYDSERQGKMKTQLQAIAEKPDLSKDVREIVRRALDF